MLKETLVFVILINFHSISENRVLSSSSSSTSDNAQILSRGGRNHQPWLSSWTCAPNPVFSPPAKDRQSLESSVSPTRSFLCEFYQMQRKIRSPLLGVFRPATTLSCFAYQRDKKVRVQNLGMPGRRLFSYAAFYVNPLASLFCGRSLRSKKELAKQFFKREIRPIETGGGGDCLFHSIAYGLRETDIRDPSGELYKVPSLRNLVAEAVTSCYCGTEHSASSTKSADECYDRFMEFLTMQAAVQDEGWRDLWHPREILGTSAYVSSDGKLFDTRTVAGKAVAVRHELTRSGNTHWGTEFDIHHIEQKLNVRVILIRAKTKAIYCFASTSLGVPRYYILVYYYDAEHYRSAAVAIRDQNGNRKLRSAFKPEELPKFFIQQHLQDCKHPL